MFQPLVADEEEMVGHWYDVLFPREQRVRRIAQQLLPSRRYPVTEARTAARTWPTDRILVSLLGEKLTREVGTGIEYVDFVLFRSPGMPLRRTADQGLGRLARSIILICAGSENQTVEALYDGAFKDLEARPPELEEGPRLAEYKKRAETVLDDVLQAYRTPMLAAEQILNQVHGYEATFRSVPE